MMCEFAFVWSDFDRSVRAAIRYREREFVSRRNRINRCASRFRPGQNVERVEAIFDGMLLRWTHNHIPLKLTVGLNFNPAVLNAAANVPARFYE